MGHTNDRSTKASSLVNPTSLNLQPRPFAPLESDEKEEAVSRKSGYSENFLEKIINTPSLESATPVQRKSGNRLKAIATERNNTALQNQSIQRQEAVEEEKSEGEEEDAKEFIMNPEPPPVQRKFENRLRAKNAQKMTIQAKLAIGEPNDKYEQEADATAARVVQQINSSTNASTTSQSQPVQRQEIEEDELQMKPLIQRRESIGGGEASTDLESAIQSARGSGQSLDANLQQSMGQAMGADFSGVKVHTDSQSDQLNKSIQAKAFTTGQDLFFRQGAYEPSSRSGQELIAHELTHVVQQNSSAVQRKKMGTELSNTNNSSLLQTTRERSNAFSGGNPPNITSSDVDTSSSPFLPEYEDNEVPGWKDEDEGVAEWAQEEYKRDSKRTVICSMTTDQKIGSVYFQDGSRIRTTHGAGPEKERHSHQTRLQFNVDENLAIPEFEKANPKAKKSKRYWSYFDEWLVTTLKDITVEQAPSWAKLVDKPDSANDLPTEEVKLFEIFKNINGEVESWHPSRGTATKFETDKQVISVLEAAIQHIAKTKDPKQRNIEFYEFVKSRLPKFVDHMRQPDQVN